MCHIHTHAVLFCPGTSYVKEIHAKPWPWFGTSAKIAKTVHLAAVIHLVELQSRGSGLVSLYQSTWRSVRGTRRQAQLSTRLCQQGKVIELKPELFNESQDQRSMLIHTEAQEILDFHHFIARSSSHSK